jgi:fatty-acyl-CoA synthase
MALETGYFEARTIGDLIIGAVTAYGDRVAMEDANAKYTYRQLGERIAQALSALRATGLRSGDVVAQLSGNAVDMYAVMAAAYVGGMRSLTLHTMGGLEDHTWILRDAGARLLIVDAKHVERGCELQRSVAVPVLCHEQGASLASFWDAGDKTARLPERSEGGWEDIVRIAYTGGTTGRPKGVLLSNRALVTNTRLASEAIDWPQEVRFLCPAPISHGAGSLIAPALIKGGTVLLEGGFSTARFAKLVSERRANVTWLVPTMIQKLLDDEAVADADLSSLETLVYSGSAMPVARIEQALARFGPVLVQCYGQTEAPNTVLTLNKQAHLQGGAERLSSAGRPFPGVEVAILDDEGREVPVRAPGEICVRGPLLMSGYLHQPEATASAMSNGWLRTGDIGFRDEDDFVTIVDRKKDMVISGGFNVYPREVEEILVRHPDVAAAAVFGVPDEVWGETVRALVVPRAGRSLDPVALMAMVRSAKGAVHVPKSVDIAAALPLTPLGKPDKKRMQADFMQKAG